MNNVDKSYCNLLQDILDHGVVKKDRTGTGTKSVFGRQLRFDMKEGFPLLTTKKVYFKGVVHELLWFLAGDTNIQYLVHNDVNIWNGDAYKKYKTTPIDQIDEDDSELVSASHRYLDHFHIEDFIQKIKTDNRFAKKWGHLGPVYGRQWRSWNTLKWEKTDIPDPVRANQWMLRWELTGIDQISNLINDLKTNPDSRRLMVNAWNVAEINEMTLPPCHYGFQMSTREIEFDERLKLWCSSLGKNISYGEDMTQEKLDKAGFPNRYISLMWNQRSVDTLLGLPFNIASYGVLLHLLAQEVNMIPDELIVSTGDTHLYLNHLDQAREQISRSHFKLPELKINKRPIFEITYDDIQLIDYQSHKAIKAELSN